MAITLDKQDLRERMRFCRQGLVPDERRRLSVLAASHLLGSDVWRGAGTVALYVAVRGETDTGPLLERAWAEGKTVLLPLCQRDGPGLMRFVPCRGREDLRPGAYGILEPRCQELSDTHHPAELILVPGVAFDRRGMRLGQGGGYYDRLLSLPLYAQSFRLGYAYSFQIVDDIPADPWDLPVQALCTEEGILWTT